MTKLSWDDIGSRFYESGVDRGVLYPKVGPGVSWSGIVSINEATDESSQSITYIDGQKAHTQLQLGVYLAELSAFTYPVEFEDYDGYSDLQIRSQTPKTFNLAYCTRSSNDLNDNNYKIHLVYNALAKPTSRDHLSIDGLSSAEEFTWSISTTPNPVPDAKPASHFVIDTAKAYLTSVALVEDVLYGTDTTEPKFPTVIELLKIFEDTAILKITDYGDGTWSAEGPSSIIQMLDATTFQIDWPSANYIDSTSYSIKSL
jgi:hypothetical protein